CRHWTAGNKHRQHHQKGHARREPEETKAQTKWLIAEARNRIHGVLDAADERQLPVAAGAILPVVVDDGIFVTHPGTETGQIAVLLAKGKNGVNRFAVHEAEDSRVQWNRVIGKRA